MLGLSHLLFSLAAFTGMLNLFNKFRWDEFHHATVTLIKFFLALAICLVIATVIIA